MAERTLYWGTDTGRLPPEPLKFPRQFYIGHLGAGKTLDDPKPYLQPDVANYVGPDSTYAYWTIFGPGVVGQYDEAIPQDDTKLRQYGEEQVGVFLTKLGEPRYSELVHGKTLFIDIEHPATEDTSELNKRWGAPAWLDATQQTRNQKVLDGFLYELRRRLSGSKNIGVYAAPGTFPAIFGVGYKFPFPVVVWLARWLENTVYDPIAPDFSLDAVVSMREQKMNIRIGGYYPIIWQFFGTRGDLSILNPAQVFMPSAFTDVLPTHWAYPNIQALYYGGFVQGISVSPPKYGQEAILKRSEMAVFILRGLEGSNYSPPKATSQKFADVIVSHWAVNWVTELYVRHYTQGCGFDRTKNLPIYCPENPVTRAQACVFVVRVQKRDGSYEAPPARGGFQGLDPDWWGTKWIEAAYDAGLVPKHMYERMPSGIRFIEPDKALTRAETAYMMARALGL